MIHIILKTLKVILRLVWQFIFQPSGARVKIQFFKAYEMIIYPAAFLVGYLFGSSFYFTDENESYQHFGKIQKSSLIWGPLVVSFILLINYFGKANWFKQDISIMAWSFAVMPLFILHIPDYLLCLPIWFNQYKKILKNFDNREKMMRLYEHSILFKHERLYFQLPGLHRLMLLFASRDDYLQQGIFTASLVEGLRGEAVGPSGMVSLADLAYFVGKRVPIEYQERMMTLFTIKEAGDVVDKSYQMKEKAQIKSNEESKIKKIYPVKTKAIGSGLPSQNPVLLSDSFAISGPYQVIMAPEYVPTYYKALKKRPGKDFMKSWLKFLLGY
jgi:hypothetical protein